jgi:hypothetical protein
LQAQFPAAPTKLWFQAGEIGINRTAGGGSFLSRSGEFCTEIVFDVIGRQTVLDSTAMPVSASPSVSPFSSTWMRRKLTSGSKYVEGWFVQERFRNRGVGGN